MQFSIPNIGLKIGTCGWLAAGLSDGSITIKPGKTSKGKPGLWINAKNIGDELLAIWNPYDLTNADVPNSLSFQNAVGDDFFNFGKNIPLTDAAQSYLSAIAGEWCDKQNELRSADDSAPLKALQVTIG